MFLRLFSEAIASGQLSQENIYKAYIYRGMAWDPVREVDKKIADLTKAIEINPKDVLGYTFRASAWKEKRDYDRSIADLTKIIEITPKEASAYVDRGKAWYDKGDYDKAIADYTNAIEINPKSKFAYYDRGNAWRKKHDYDRAIADYTKAIEIDSRWDLVYYNRGCAWYDKGDYDKAIADLNKVSEIDPKNTDAIKLRDYIREQKPNLTPTEKARVHMKKGLDFNKYADSLGLRDAYELAIKEFQEAVRLDPSWPDPYYNLGVTQEKLGNDKGAIAQLKKYLELAPNKPDSAKAKETISRLDNKIGQVGIAQARAVPDGFAGLPWGASTDQITKAMSGLGYRQLTGTEPGELKFKGAFAGQRCILTFQSIVDTYYSGSADFDSNTNYVEPRRTFEYTVRMISEKYGQPRNRSSNKDTANVTAAILLEWANWQLVDGKSDKYDITVSLYKGWHADGTLRYQAYVSYNAESLQERLKKKGF